MLHFFLLLFLRLQGTIKDLEELVAHDLLRLMQWVLTGAAIECPFDGKNAQKCLISRSSGTDWPGVGFTMVRYTFGC